MLKKDLPITITSSSYPGEKFPGKISVVDPFISDATRTGRVRIDVENPDFKLRPDMYVDVDLTMTMGEGVAVPFSAVLPTGNHNIVFVDKGGGKLEPRFIELGRKYGDYYEVKSGLNENERVVTSANFLIDAEAKVQAHSNPGNNENPWNLLPHRASRSCWSALLKPAPAISFWFLFSSSSASPEAFGR